MVSDPRTGVAPAVERWSGGDLVGGLADCKVSKTCSRVSPRAVCRAPDSTGSVWTAVISRRRPRYRQLGAARPGPGRATARRRRVSTPPASTISSGSSTATIAARPTASRCADLAAAAVSPGPGSAGRGDRGLRRTRPEAQRARQLEHLLATGEFLEAAGVVAADVADQRRAGQRHEADLAGTAGRAAEQAAADHYRGADALLAPEQDEVVDCRRRARPALGDRGQVHVVLDLERHSERLRELVEQVAARASRAGAGVAQPAGRRVERHRGADETRCRRSRSSPASPSAPSMRLTTRSTVRWRRAGRVGSSKRADHLAGQVRDGGADPGRRDVQRGDVREAGVDLVQLRVRAGAAVADAAGTTRPAPRAGRAAGRRSAWTDR